MNTATIHPTAEGEHRKLSAFALLAAHREVLIRRARRALLAVLIDRGEGTIDDVRAVVPVPDGIKPKVFGPDLANWPRRASPTAIPRAPPGNSCLPGASLAAHRPRRRDSLAGDTSGVAGADAGAVRPGRPVH